MQTPLTFPAFNAGYRQLFQPSRLSIGLVVPIAQYGQGELPDLAGQLKLIQYAEQLGFASVWLRDIPFHVPQFGDDGQVFDPFVYLGALAIATRQITLGIASLILPLRHPAHVAKAAASVDQLSAGRLVLGVASGDRAAEYPAMGLDHNARSTRFRDAFQYLRQSFSPEPHIRNSFGILEQSSSGLNIYPKPHNGRLPLLITGASQQNIGWQSVNADGVITYPRDLPVQQKFVNDWRRQQYEARNQITPVMQPLYLDITDNPYQALQPIHLGVRGGIKNLAPLLRQYQQAGINHICFNLRFNQPPLKATLEQLAAELFPEFSIQNEEL